MVGILLHSCTQRQNSNELQLVCRLLEREECYVFMRAIEDRASSAFARIASALAPRKSRNVRNTAEGSPSGHTAIRSRYRSGMSRTNRTPFDRRMLVEAGTIATPLSASTNEIGSSALNSARSQPLEKNLAIGRLQRWCRKPQALLFGEKV